MKRSVAMALGEGVSNECVADAKEAAVRLLTRSIGFRHRRLALLRLQAAVRVGAVVPPQHWAYCLEVTLTSQDEQLKIFYEDARSSAICAKPHERRL